MRRIFIKVRWLFLIAMAALLVLTAACGKYQTEPLIGGESRGAASFNPDASANPSASALISQARCEVAIEEEKTMTDLKAALAETDDPRERAGLQLGIDRMELIWEENHQFCGDSEP
jgi:hypothetical protein